MPTARIPLPNSKSEFGSGVNTTSGVTEKFVEAPPPNVKSLTKLVLIG